MEDKIKELKKLIIEKLEKKKDSMINVQSDPIKEAKFYGFIDGLNWAIDNVKILFDDNSLSNEIKNIIDLAYITGVFNMSGIDGLLKELKRLKEIKIKPHDILNIK